MTPWATLRVLPSVTPEGLRAAFRARARETHPDRGGDPAEFAAVAQAYEAARNLHEFLAHAKVCEKCGGFGVVRIKKGMSPAEAAICQQCNGEGST